ncbi:hypothetical protein PHYBLDRAFT_66959 [Phycomyces blakesleeanus NRRL 1555(-)]|uniref:Secreted protein n=1 Tax=Phycomyces blakesleeanus (strain ATCC 8743b / DSM 1359 / FGSC 10004 / NBRC 33097 / NRRL 1555) TaxID=763407 RepID=A0A167KTN0_PHYB8|nr:hypothetical protein PHYBLDRAFT_66959 [Phycomyces blakesleeanus NRRL 1555(-)]OAD68849.1 hypothetical protein PHYBLDRAFT_66959 [Phycomyces blakesleeanus NRRL 1555(-)]|eukprot:XP_018286889.1 hypothetical protein PHYBLDRAFT_66959 [Phycomyces blakesleeanus NRRL 1555(-)]
MQMSHVYVFSKLWITQILLVVDMNLSAVRHIPLGELIIQNYQSQSNTKETRAIRVGERFKKNIIDKISRRKIFNKNRRDTSCFKKCCKKITMIFEFLTTDLLKAQIEILLRIPGNILRDIWVTRGSVLRMLKI